jgi:Uma2 family endonuclease
MVTQLSDLDLSKSYTYSDYLTWRFDEMVELIKGKIYKMSPAPARRHQEIVGNLYTEFNLFLKRKPCKVFIAPFNVRFKKTENTQEITTVLQPDICVVCDSAKLDLVGCVGVPDLIVEILSPSTSEKDIKIKFGLYEEFGVKEYWIVSPNEQVVDVFYLDGEKYVLNKKYISTDRIPVKTLPGFELDLKEVFES